VRTRSMSAGLATALNMVAPSKKARTQAGCESA